MDDEFKLCWKNFQDNIASGFQNLYDRGDLVDVTLACDGKLLHAHKIVLAICSPYFQEIFITNPCKHPIIILKDVHFNIMCELLEFMYQGVVNVKHTELQSFMKIGQLLQIKGLATNPPTSSASAGLDEKGSSDIKNSAEFLSNADADSMNSSSNTLKDGKSYDSATKITTNSQNTSVKGSVTSPASSPSSPKNSISQESMVQNNFPTGLKRLSELNSDAASNYSKKPFRRSASHLDPNSDQNDGHNSDGVDNVNPEDFFLSIPHISMVESRYDLNSVKREGDPNSNSSMANSMRSSFGSSLGFEYNLYKNNGGLTTNSSSEFPNELHVPNDYSKNFGNHMDIPPSSNNNNNVTMLSSTSLLHGNCVFNRNNTVATQQGMKTYWLCKSYRISMCRARCITHQGKVISATGVHNHPPHMRNGSTVVGGGCYPEGMQANTSLPSNHLCNVPAGGNMPSSLMQAGALNINSVTGAGCFPNVRFSQASSNLFQHNIGGNPMNIPQQSNQYPQHPHPHPHSVPSSLINATQLQQPHHFGQQNPNLIIQQHTVVQPTSNISVSSQQQQLIPSQSGSALSPISQPPNSVIQNMVHNGNNSHLSPLMNTSNPISPHLRDNSVHSANSSLIISPVGEESPQRLHSPMNNNQPSSHSVELASHNNHHPSKSSKDVDLGGRCSSEHIRNLGHNPDSPTENMHRVLKTNDNDNRPEP